MTKKRKIQNAIDLCMVLLLPVMMSYSLAGEQLHEVLGMTMGTLFLCHTPAGLSGGDGIVCLDWSSCISVSIVQTE